MVFVLEVLFHATIYYCFLVRTNAIFLSKRSWNSVFMRTPRFYVLIVSCLLLKTPIG